MEVRVEETPVTEGPGASTSTPIPVSARVQPGRSIRKETISNLIGWTANVLCTLTCKTASTCVYLRMHVLFSHTSFFFLLLESF